MLLPLPVPAVRAWWPPHTGTELLIGSELLPSSASSTLLPKPPTYKVIKPFLSLETSAGFKVVLGPLAYLSASKALALFSPPISPG